MRQITVKGAWVHGIEGKFWSMVYPQWWKPNLFVTATN